MKSCPTSNMNRSQLWGFEVSHIVSSFAMLAGTNVLLNVLGAPLFLSWGFGFGTLGVLRFISHGQKNGHLEMLARYLIEPHVYIGHSGRHINKLGD